MFTVPAAPGFKILIFEGEGAYTEMPVIAFEIVNSIAFPILAVPFRGLVSGLKALQTPDGYIIERGFETPFESIENWLKFCKNFDGQHVEQTRPGAPEPREHTERMEPEPAGTTDTQQQAESPPTEADNADPVFALTGKTFKTNSFWLHGERQLLTTVPGGEFLPDTKQGWEKITGDSFREAKKNDAYTVIDWPYKGSPDAVDAETASNEADGGEPAYDDGDGLV